MNLVSFQQWLEHEYLLQMYPINNTTRGELLKLETLGKDYEDEYGYMP